MDKNRFTELLTKKVSGSLTLPESRELQQYLNQHPEEQELSLLLDQIWHIHFDQQSSFDQDRQEQFINRLHQKIQDQDPVETNSSPKLLYRRHWWLVAAIIAVVLGLGVIIYQQFYNSPTPISAPSVHMTQKGSKSVVELPDGTAVWLNADSRLTYDNSYGEQSRTVTLSGEAYFEVVHNENIPFIVQTRSMDVRVLGTSFNVRAYDEDATAQTTLIKGKVEVYLRNKAKEKILLKPHEKLLVKNIPAPSDTNRLSVSDASLQNIPEMAVVTISESATPDSLVNEIQWTQNRLVFDQTTFSDIVKELERWYGVKITVNDPNLLNRKLSGIFENESLTEVLESFQLAVGFRYKLRNHNLTLY